jgi:hypothetical protein
MSVMGWDSTRSVAAACKGGPGASVEANGAVVEDVA